LTALGALGAVGAGASAVQAFAPDAGQTTSPTVETPGQAAGFQPVGRFQVRFDRLERPRGSAVVRAVVTIRNPGRQTRHLPSGTFRAVLTDADGAGQERNQIWRGSGEPAATFNGTPAVAPGEELTVRFIFNPDIPRLGSLTLASGQEQAVFDLTGA
jgi:hypothetical protein